MSISHALALQRDRTGEGAEIPHWPPITMDCPELQRDRTGEGAEINSANWGRVFESKLQRDRTGEGAEIPPASFSAPADDFRFNETAPVKVRK